MKHLNITKTVFVLTASFFLAGQSARAEDPRFLSAYHSEYGLKLLNDEKYDLAVERLAKAFLLDPKNKTAKESLQKIAAEQSRQGSRGLKILRFIDQVEYIDFLTARYEGLTEENARLLQFLRNSKNLANDALLLEKFHTVETQISLKPSALPRVGLIGFAGDETKTIDLSSLTNQLADERADLAKEVVFWEERNNQLRDFRKKVLFQNSAENPTVVAVKYKSQLDEVARRVVEKDQLLTVQQQNIDYFKNELTAVRNDFTALQEKIKTTDFKITELTSRIAEMSVELFEKNKILGEKDDLATDLQKDLGIANEKITLVQRIIQEKDERISILENEITQVHVNVASGNPSSDAQVAQVQSDLKNFETEFKDQIEKSRERIVTLEVQYADLTTKYEVVLKDAQAKNVLANQYKDAFLQTDQKANQLIGMIEIYRGKLSDVKQNLSSKEDELRQLQGVLFNINAPAAQSKSHEQTAPKVSEVTPSAGSYDLTFSKPSSTNRSLQTR